MKAKNSILFSLLFIFGILMISLSSASINELTNSLANNNKDTDGSVSWTATFNATINETLTCTLDFSQKNPGSSSYSMTATNTSDSATGKVYTCTKTITSIPSQIYEWTISATNVSDTTTTTSRTLIVDTSTDNSGAVANFLNSQNTKPSNGKSLSIASAFGNVDSKQIITITIILFSLIVLFNKKKR